MTNVCFKTKIPRSKFAGGRKDNGKIYFYCNDNLISICWLIKINGFVKKLKYAPTTTISQQIDDQ